MASLFLLIAALVLRRAGAGPLADPATLGTGAVTLVTLAGTLGAALAGALLGVLPWNRPAPGAHAAWSRSARRTRWIGSLACLWLAACIVGLGWLDVVRAWLGDLVLVDEAVAVLPALLAMAIAWWCHAGHVREIAAVRSRWSFVASQARTQLPIFLAPVALVLGSQEVVDRLFDSRSPFVEGAALATAVVALLLSPAAVVALLATSPLPTRNDMAQRIDALFADAGIRLRGVRLWRTDGMLVNGLALGVLPFCRWVLLTDALFSTLTDEEIMAVAGHEAAHLKHHHAAWLVGGLLGAAGCATVAAGALLQWGQPLIPPGAATEWAVMALVAIIVILFFGAVSRTCERQADAFAAKTLSAGDSITPEAAGAMRRALAVVAFANGIPPHRPSFRHGSIASRRQRLASLVGCSKARLPIDRRMRLVQWLVAATLVVTALSMLLSEPTLAPEDRMIPAADPRP